MFISNKRKKRGSAFPGGWRHWYLQIDGFQVTGAMPQECCEPYPSPPLFFLAVLQFQEAVGSLNFSLTVCCCGKLDWLLWFGNTLWLFSPYTAKISIPIQCNFFCADAAVPASTACAVSHRGIVHAVGKALASAIGLLDPCPQNCWHKSKLIHVFRSGPEKRIGYGITPPPFLGLTTTVSALPCHCP